MISVERESKIYANKKFKEEAMVTTPDIKNNFITEEMLLFPLYKKIKINKKEKVYNFFPYNDVRIECYCKKCNARRIFAFENSQTALNSLMYVQRIGSMTESTNNYTKNTMDDKMAELDFFSFYAMADCKHKMIIHFMKIDDETIMKIGQFPSIYDLNSNINNKKFLKCLGEEYAEYYKNACSLYSFNTYIGALVYLRRIFEKLLIDTFNDNNEQIAISFDEFKAKKMADKVKLLKPYLPQIMFSQGFNSVYTKISDGIHNLNEEECSKMFLVLKMAIEEILTEKFENEEKKKRISAISKELQNL